MQYRPTETNKTEECIYFAVFTQGKKWEITLSSRFELPTLLLMDLRTFKSLDYNCLDTSTLFQQRHMLKAGALLSPSQETKTAQWSEVKSALPHR